MSKITNTKKTNTKKTSRIGSTQSHSCSIPDYTHTTATSSTIEKTGICKHTN